MPNKTPISWTDYTWNIARGCTKVSDGCKFCYMMRDGNRYKYDGKRVKQTGKSTFNKPYTITGQSGVWDGPPLIFTSSLTDFFHEDCDEFRELAWEIIRNNPNKIFQILTKRPERIFSNLPPDWGKGYKNVWLGISVENQEQLIIRMEEFLGISARVRFISIEPLIGPVHIWTATRTKPNGDYPYPIDPRLRSKYATFIDWVIVGGESGNDNGPWGYRACEQKWIEDIIYDCRHIPATEGDPRHNIPVFVKQLGTHLGKELKCTRHGKDILQFPKHLQIRQFPAL